MSGLGKLFASFPIKPAAPRPPLNLCVYYGWTSSMGAAFFMQYDLVVLGDGLDNPAHPDHENTQVIIQKLVNLKIPVFGYIDIGNPQSLPELEILSRITLWESMGATGIFMDDAGDDYALPNLAPGPRRDTILDFIHTHKMNAMINAWNVEDALNSKWMPGDWYMAESYETSSPPKLADIKTARSRGLKVAGLQVYKPGAKNPGAGALDAFGWADDDSYGANGKMTFRGLG